MYIYILLISKIIKVAKNKERKKIGGEERYYKYRKNSLPLEQGYLIEFGMHFELLVQFQKLQIYLYHFDNSAQHLMLAKFYQLAVLMLLVNPIIQQNHLNWEYHHSWI